MIKLLAARGAALTSVFAVLTSIATAQTPADALKGTWVAQTLTCGKSIVAVTSVEPNGIVRGTFVCEKVGWKPVMGEKIEKDAVRAVLTGNRFVMENADGGGLDLVLDATTLKGFGKGRRESANSPVTYQKQ